MKMGNVVAARVGGGGRGTIKQWNVKWITTE